MNLQLLEMFNFWVKAMSYLYLRFETCKHIKNIKYYLCSHIIHKHILLPSCDFGKCKKGVYFYLYAMKLTITINNIT